MSFSKGDLVIRLKKHQSFSYWRGEVGGEEYMGKPYRVRTATFDTIDLEGLKGSYNSDRFELAFTPKPLEGYM